MAQRVEDTTVVMQRLLDRVAAGDAAARNLLLDHAAERLRKIASRQLRGFPLVKRWEDTGDVLNAAVLRMMKALEAASSPSLLDFYGLCALQIRRELIDLKRRYYGPQGMGRRHATDVLKAPGDSTAPNLHEPVDEMNDPADRAAWNELHEHVQGLPSDLRTVFDLRWYNGLTEEEAARVLNLSARSVRRRWCEARVELGKFLQGDLA